MKHQKFLNRLLSMTLAGVMVTAQIPVIQALPANEVIEFSFENYQGNAEVNLPFESDTDGSKAFKVYGFEKNKQYVQAIPIKVEENGDKSLMMTTSLGIEEVPEVTTQSALQVEKASGKLDCAMEGINLEGNFAIEFDARFEDSYSEKALFRGKYADEKGALSWHTPTQVSIKEDNKLYIGKKAIVDCQPDTWYQIKMVFDLEGKDKLVSYWLDGQKIAEVELENSFVALNTIKFLQIHGMIDQTVSRSYIDNYKIYTVEVPEEPQEVIEKNFLLFENEIQDFISTDVASTLSLSNKRVKFGETSLKWTVGESGELYFDTEIGYESFGGSMSDQRRETFVVWIYNETPTDEKLIFEFGTDDRRDTGFEFGLDFTGWRSAWVMFDRDMEGTPTVDMNKLTIKAPESMEGKDLYFSNVILSTPLDARHHTRSEQVPFVNIEGDSKANSHWMSLYAFSQSYENFKPEGKLTNQHLEDAQLLEERYDEYLYELKKPITFEELVKQYESYEIKIEREQIKGRSIDYGKANAILDEFDKDHYLKKFNSISSKDYFKALYDMAVFYTKASDETQKEQVKEMFINMFWHLYDQGFAKGSSIGTVHHLGYEMRDYYPALYLMKDVLKEAGWLEEATAAMNWFSGVGRIFYEDLKADGVNMDVLNTLLESMLASILMEDDENLRAELLREFTEWLTFASSPKPGLMGPFKESGLGFHHRGFYPAYTRDGLKGLTPIIYLLRGTEYRLPEEQHELIKKAVMNFRIFSNREQFLLSISGRHPKGTEKFPVTGFKYMALAGTPDGTEAIDQEVAAAYMRLVDKANDPLVLQFKDLGIEKEKAPTGNWAMNDAALALHRRAEWLVGVRGHSRYLWANETYESANLYGRYITHGQIQIMSQGTPVNNEASGYKQEGWDWNSWPGTTTIHLPMDELKSDVRNVDTFSGFEEMLISDETYAGALDIEGTNGMFAMKLHEHPKYNGSHRARKSVFMFEDRVIALGSDIQNTVTDHPTRTTLFQSYLTDANEPILVNSVEGVTGLGYQKEMETEEVSYLMDNNNNGYILPAGQKLTITREKQESRHQQNSSKTEGEFTKAVIEHGTAPKGEDYEYMILVDTTPEELEAMTGQIKEGSQPTYTVLQKDTNAHIVKDHGTQTTGYALFEANEKINKGDIAAIDTPAMVMAKEEGESLVLSVCDPDLRLYEGKDESQYDENGNQIEVSIYSREWGNNEGKMHTLNLEVIGEWKLSQASENCRVVAKENGNTLLAVDCKEGVKVEVKLEKDETTTEPPVEPPTEPEVKPEKETSDDGAGHTITSKQPHLLQDIEKHWAKEAIEKVVAKGLMKGESNALFKPDNQLTRAEMAVILDRLLPDKEEDKVVKFKDIPNGTWYSQSIYKMAKQGVIKGYEDGTYRPNETMTRMEVMAMLSRALQDDDKYQEVKEIDTVLAPYGNLELGWAQEEVVWCIVNELLEGDENKDLKLEQPITRAEMAVLLTRIMNK